MSPHGLFIAGFENSARSVPSGKRPGLVSKSGGLDHEELRPVLPRGKGRGTVLRALDGSDPSRSGGWRHALLAAQARRAPRLTDLLSRRLKELEAEGIVERRPADTGRGWTYHLTRAGNEFAPIIEGLGVWGQRWSRRELAKHEINLTLLMWGLELTFADQPRARGTGGSSTRMAGRSSASRSLDSRSMSTSSPPCPT